MRWEAAEKQVVLCNHNLSTRDNLWRIGLVRHTGLNSKYQAGWRPYFVTERDLY